MLSEYDANDDGFISLTEFIGDIRGDGKIIEIFLKHKMICSLSVSSYMSNFCLPCILLSLVMKMISLQSGRLRKQCGSQTSMIKTKMAC